jgi:predicted alpha/beta hydrolase family esterase
MHCIFIHSTGGNPEEAFLPWVRARLEEKGIKTSAPILPSSEWPDREGWKQAVLSVYDPQQETILVGRSLGGTLIPHVLENIQVKATFSLAAPINHLGWENLMDFFSKGPDYMAARKHVEHYEHWYSDDDPYVDLEQGKEFQELLGGEFRVFKGYSHFYNTEFPELLQSIQKLLI